MNTHLPAIVCRKSPAAESWRSRPGIVYGLVPATCGGSLETDPLAPVGEYAHELPGPRADIRAFQRTLGTRVALVRLNYACDLPLRRAGGPRQEGAHWTPVDLGMGWFNTLWQGDANAMTLALLRPRRLAAVGAEPYGPEGVERARDLRKARTVAGPAACFVGTEAPTALLSNAPASVQLVRSSARQR